MANIDLSTPRLDITSWKQKGQELHDAIIKECKGLSESLLFMPMPAILDMTQIQYDDLMALSKLPNMYHTDDRMFITPYNIMEVRVQGRTKSTFIETMQFTEKEFVKWEKEHAEEIKKEESHG